VTVLVEHPGRGSLDEDPVSALVTHAQLDDGGAPSGHRLPERIARTLNVRGMNEADR